MESYAAALSLSSFRASNFAPAFFFLSRARRNALRAIYAFCRAVDDVVDESPAGDDAAVRSAEAALSDWRAFLRDPREPRAEDLSPKAALRRALYAAFSDFGVNPKHLSDLADGVAVDLHRRRYRTFEELKAYCHGVASTVGLACLPLFDLDEKNAGAFAENLGLAVQLTNILRDVRTDFQKDRLYLPEEDMARFGVREADLSAPRPAPSFVALMRFESERADDFYRKAGASLPVSARRSARPALIMGALYRRLLRKLDRLDFDVFSRPRVSLSSWEKGAAVLDGLFHGGRL